MNSQSKSDYRKYTAMDRSIRRWIALLHNEDSWKSIDFLLQYFKLSILRTTVRTFI